jgi:hypothetical protein
MIRPPLTRRIIGLLLVVLPWTSHAEEGERGRFGVALNTSFNGEVTPLRLVPSLTWATGKSQLEAGLGIHPFIRREQRVFSGELNAKVFPNGTDRLLSPYLIGRFSYVNNDLETYYPTTYHYLFLNGGYGLVLSGNDRSYVGTNVTGGLFTFARRSENPYPGFDRNGLFQKVGLNLAFQFNVGYRF